MKSKLRENAMLLVFFVSSLVVVIIAIAAGRMVVNSAAMIEDSTRRQMTALSEAAVHLTTAEELDLFQTVADMDKPEYRQLKERLNAFTQTAEIMFTYYMRLDRETDQMQFIVDNVLDPLDEPDGLDSLPVDREPGPDRALEGIAAAVELGDYSEGWDGLLTAWAPIYYQDGTLSNMVAGVDMQDIYIKAARRNTYALSIVLIVSMVIVLASCLTCLNMYRKKAGQMADASRAKSTFLSRMSHEMRTPMNAIMGMCDMALETDDPAKTQEYLENIQISSRHLRRVIDDVLDISKIESGKMTLEYISADFRQEMEQVRMMVLPQAEAKSQRFSVAIASDVPEYLRFDAVHIRQILVNLLSNAIKFTPEAGEVSLVVTVRQAQGSRILVEWRVTDSGIGMDEAGLSRLFTAFEQGDVSTTRKYGGTGLGLAISKQLADMMGGTITVESSLGNGSVFTLALWLELAEDANVEPQTDDDLPLDLTGKRLLLVEDSEINRLIAIDLFERFGATVEVACDGQEAVDAFSGQPDGFDMIFMDVQMPVMDGYEATRQIRKSGLSRAATVPIIAMTANVFREDVDRALASGMDGHVGKPFDVDQIKRTIRQVSALATSNG